MTFSRQIAARIREKERQKEAARQAAIDAALAKPPPPGVTKDNWSHWHRHGWIVCPATRDLTCSDLPVVSVVSATAWPRLGLPATAHRSDARTGLAAAPGPRRAPPV